MLPSKDNKILVLKDRVLVFKNKDILTNLITFKTIFLFNFNNLLKFIIFKILRILSIVNTCSIAEYAPAVGGLVSTGLSYLSLPYFTVVIR